MSEGHARLGPSNARWPKCPGSVREEAQYPDIAGEAAIDGTGSHLLLEMCLQNGVAAVQYDQQIIGANHPDNPGGWLVDLARCARVQMALDYITRRVGELKTQFPRATVTVEAECKADPGGAFGRDDWWGTVDITITARDQHTGEVYFIEVADYKDGRMYVSEKNNTQLGSYLFGKMRPHVASGPDLVQPFVGIKVGGCRVTIIQPKTNPVIRYQCTTRFEDDFTVQGVIDAARELAEAARLTDEPDAPVLSGKHCQWCKANPKRGGHCAAETENSLQVVENMSDNNFNLEVKESGDLSGFSNFKQALADPKSLTEVQLTELADAEAGIQAVFDKVKAEIQQRIEQGISVRGYAMMPGNGANVWNEDEETIAKKLKGRRLKNADIYPAKLISPAAVMKLDDSLLSAEQKERIKKDLISYVASDKKSLKKVAYDDKTVVQSETSSVESTSSVELMFAEVPKPETETVSFF